MPRDRAAGITAPKLVAIGEACPDFFERAARATADAIPGAQHRVLAGQAWDRVDPGALARMLRDFLL